MFWRPMRDDHNLRRVQHDTRSFINLLRAVASVRLKAEVERAAAEDSEEALREVEADRTLLALLNNCRAAATAIRRAARYTIPDVSRFFGSAAAELISLFEAAQRNLNDVRGFLAYVLGERDDEELGCAFIPPPPNGLGSSPSVELSGTIPAADCSEPLRLRFTEGAAFQVSEMHARAIASPDGVHALV